MLNTKLILIPVLIQIVLTVSLYIALSVFKKKAVKQGDVNEARRSLYDDAWPEYVLKINNCIRNQFEVPVLFYTLALAHLIIDVVDHVALLICWLFVISRLLHAYVHTGSNVVSIRRKLFTVGVLMIIVLSINLFRHLL